MSNSLRDQLVKAGLATASQAKKAQRAQEANRSRNKKDGSKGSKKGARAGGEGAAKKPELDTSPEGLAKARARQQRAEKAERDRAIAKVRNEKAAQKALRAQIKQLIAAHDVRAKDAREDDAPYNFVHGKKVKRIYVPKQQVEDLSAGRLVIVNNDGRYHIVSKEIAGKIKARDPKWIVAAHDQTAASDETMDDYYKRFEVPDDLDW